MKIKIDNKKGFTIIELVVSIGIFAMMTALLLAKYGNFNQGILLNNLAYDVALTIRSAQSYGLNVKSTGRDTSDFKKPFGVHFTKTNSFVFFADVDSNAVFDVTTDIVVASTTIKRGSRVSALFAGTDSGSGIYVNSLDVTFKRPDPNAIFKLNGQASVLAYSYAEITLSASDGTTKKVVVRSTGQIAVEN